MKSSTKRLTSAFIALALFVGAFVIFFDFVQPVYGDLMTSRGQLLSEQGTLQNESSTIAKIQTIMSQYNDEGVDQDQVSQALPVGTDLANAITQLYGLAEVSSLTVQNIGISVTSQNGRSGTGGPQTASMLATHPTGTIAFAITADGTYEGLLNFLSGLESNLRIFNVQQLSIQSQPVVAGSKTTTVQDFFTYSLTVDTYYQVP